MASERLINRCIAALGAGVTIPDLRKALLESWISEEDIFLAIKAAIVSLNQDPDLVNKESEFYVKWTFGRLTVSPSLEAAKAVVVEKYPRATFTVAADGTILAFSNKRLLAKIVSWYYK